ncbi:MAG: Nucleoside diphosphate kinase [Parcubacteria group bacterium ADurb.Bin305]|nr:nucleoside-diphosphate kinase [Candidatus Paceibacterota bacterium]OQA43497.1 MAG: Nucleoside diphosphate kinase [Parcubacteria group bacterium ADurb.Bin305]
MINKQERSLVLIKPDGVQRGLIGEIIKRYERSGLKLVGLKMILANEDQIERHYTVDPEWKQKTGQRFLESYRTKGIEPPTNEAEDLGEMVLSKLKKYMTSGPIIAMVFEGMNAVKIIRKITGATEPLSSDVGTIRGDFTLDSYEVADFDNRAVRNLIHASSSTWEADREIAIWFTSEELISYRLIGEAILYDVNLDGIIE